LESLEKKWTHKDSSPEIVYSNDTSLKLGDLDIVMEWNVTTNVTTPQLRQTECRAKTIIPLAQAKRLQYYLAECLKIHEILFGVITVPKVIWPAEPTEPQNADLTNVERQFYEWRKKKYAEFVKEQQK